MGFKPSLTDEILAGNFTCEGYVKVARLKDFRAAFIDAHKDLELVIADNVAEYYYAGTDKEYWDLGEDYPSIAPPWGKFSVEWRRPSRVVSTAGNKSSNNLPYRAAIFFIAMDQEEAVGALTDEYLDKCRDEATRAYKMLAAEIGDTEMTRIVRKFHDHCQRHGSFKGSEDEAPNAFQRWIASFMSADEVVVISPLITAAAMPSSNQVLRDGFERQTKAIKWNMSYSCFMQPEKYGEILGPIISGSIMIKENGGYFSHQTCLIGDSPPNERERARFHDATRLSGGMLQVPAMTLSFLHTKNVVVHEQSPPTADRERWYSKKKTRLHKYKVLEIRPFQEQVRKISSDDKIPMGDAAKKALHLCRGHFKDYRGKGLFGKFKGIYWWDEFSRGDGDLGTVVKDYAVSTEHKEPVCGNVVQP